MAYQIRHSSSPAMHNEAFATLGLGRLISLPFAGPLSDKLGRRFSVIIGCASYVVFLVGIATRGIKLFISVAQLLMPFFLGVAAGTMVALFVTIVLITKFKQVRFLVIYPAISLIMLALVYMIKTPMICYIGAFVLGYAAAGGVLQMAIVMNIVITAIGVLLALFVNLRYDVLLKNTENQ
jgi:MFS family permease